MDVLKEVIGNQFDGLDLDAEMEALREAFENGELSVTWQE